MQTNEPGQWRGERSDSPASPVGLTFPTKSGRRLYVALLTAGAVVLYLLAISHPGNRALSAAFASSLFWFTISGRGSRLSPLLPIARTAAEIVPERDVILLRSFRVVACAWIAAGLLFGSLVYSAEYSNQTWWHPAGALSLWALVVFSVNFPKAALILEMP